MASKPTDGLRTPAGSRLKMRVVAPEQWDHFLPKSQLVYLFDITPEIPPDVIVFQSGKPNWNGSGWLACAKRKAALILGCF